MAKNNKLKDSDISYILETIEDEVVVEEIPSDAESIIDDVEDLDDQNQIQELFDNILAVDNEDKHFDEGENPGCSGVLNSCEQFDTDDDIPISNLCSSLVEVTPPNWSKQNSIEIPIAFTGMKQGPTEVVENVASHDNFNTFSKIITKEIIEHIVFQTNLYAQQSGKRYTPTNALEIQAFIGINFLMGIKAQASYRDYWSSRPELNDGFISKIMPIRRFDWILSNIHLNDSTLMPKK